LANLFFLLSRHVRASQLGRVWCAPLGVRLPDQPVPVQPDILFVPTERLGIVGSDYVEGAPDLVIEILSPSNWLYDRQEKYSAYEQARVREYWLVDDRARTVEVFVLEAGEFSLAAKRRSGEIVESQVLEGFTISVDEVFAE
jgi:Uma2 family endonuclease